MVQLKRRRTPQRRTTETAISANIAHLPKETFPEFIAPQLAQSASTVPSGNDWLHELKLDGYRIQIYLRPNSTRAENPRAQLLTRTGQDWTARMPDIAGAAVRLDVASAILDGEAVALDEHGVSNFAELQAAFHEGRQRYITYFAFDLLHLDGHNLRGLPLSDRKKILVDLLHSTDNNGPLRLSEATEEKGELVYQHACRVGAEGIVSKLVSAEYVSGRSSAWLKLKCYREQEFVIGGFTLPSNGMVGVGALLLGYYERGELQYAGRTGTGFTQATHRSLRTKLNRMVTTESPFVDVPRTMRRGVHWVKPKLVAQVAFSTWTRDNLVRQAAYKGLREDKPATEVVRERVISLADGEPSTSKKLRWQH